VGVNVPTATTMVITSAERFGLSTLHQLRGRVGRGDAQSYCVLESDNQTDKALARLQVMCETNDGFKIAEADLANRGAGDLIGTQQAGSNKYVQLMLANPEKYKTALEAAKIILDKNLRCPMLTKLQEIQEEGTEVS
ncbi:MAG: ATP-dependent DNA helicase RecG, partial [Firmicutes bacterium]|nr:ATP-dependent DNA helicase RecG [Bacillota bacterium]